MRTADRALGIASDCIAVKPSPFGYSYDKVLTTGRSNRGGAVRGFFFFFEAIFKYDIFVFNFGTSFFPRRTKFLEGKNGIRNIIVELVKSFFEGVDLFLLKAIGKKIVFIFQGSDIRPSHITKQLSESSKPSFQKKINEEDFFIRRWITIANRYADALYYLNPDLGMWLPEKAEYLPYSHVNYRDYRYVGLAPGKVIRFAHAPSKRGIKGTETVLNTFKKLRIEGYDFEFELIEKVSNRQAWERYKTADIIIDQLKIGWYGGLAVEAMVLGKPVICYLKEEDLFRIPLKMQLDLPIIRVDADSLYEVLVSILRKPKESMNSISLASRRFVEMWHDPIEIERRILENIGVRLQKTSI